MCVVQKDQTVGTNQIHRSSSGNSDLPPNAPSWFTGLDGSAHGPHAQDTFSSLKALKETIGSRIKQGTEKLIRATRGSFRAEGTGGPPISG